MLERQRSWPLAQNATATHDTKRGEDARMRLNVLTEIPEKWAKILDQWQTENQPFIQMIDGHQAPSRNRIFYLYQALLAAFPMNGQPEADFLDRVKEALTKAMREAKMYSNWSEPNEKYEQEALAFLDQIFADGTEFKSSFQDFAKYVSFYGMLYSLCQTLLKITAPGIPDIYQGCELWDLSMVDPDNRRPVDFELRKSYLKELQETPENAMENALKSMLQTWPDGKIKMYLTWRALQFRQANTKLFTEGEYLPLKLEGNPNVLAFAWNLGPQWSLVILPLETVKLTQPETFPLGKVFWHNEVLTLPAHAPKTWKNIFTDQTLSGENKLALADIFAWFPVACLTSESL
jgi:(1->4)-alpha-D-glucan 1-alpha-D-glucosylmutase